jgi:transcriptional regulator with XRE-family HTH domain
MLKDKISSYLNKLMRELGETQEGLAKRIGIKKSSLQGYLKGENLPGIDVLLAMAELGGITIDQLVKTEPSKLHIEIKNSHSIAIAGRDVYMNTKIHRKTEYRPGPDDITGEQANKLKDLVNKVVEIEQKTKKKPKTYGAVWNSLNKKMGVTYYREIKREQFELAELYLMQWIGRLKKGLKRTDADEWRKDKQAAIFAAARNNLGWTKDAIDGYIYERFKKESIRDLTKKELQLLYNAIFARKNR